MNLASEADYYRLELHKFIYSTGLPKHWFERQDHLAFKAYNPQDYEALVESFKPVSERILEAELDGRRISAAKLIGGHSLDMTLSFSDNPSKVSWIELMEAKPGDQSDEPVSLDHEEIHFPNGIIPIRAVLRRRKIPYLDQENSSHGWVSLIINERGDELKFTDKPLETIVLEELETGTSRVIHTNGAV